ncbi:hypothetical protein DCS32_06560 [Dokdonia sp. Dokd-P16]|nr:hypothetical protein DCS32_06560 [Dokdonia sp. Dokd-P16]
MKNIFMTKNIVMFFIGCSITALSYGQKIISYKLKAGANYSKYSSSKLQSVKSDFLVFDYVLGGYFGGGVSVPLSYKVELSSGLLLSFWGTKVDINYSNQNIFDSNDNNFREDVNGSVLGETSILIPFFIEYNIWHKLSLGFGPQVNYLLSTKDDYDGDTNEGPIVFIDEEPFGVDLIIQSSYDLSSKIEIEGGYYFGLNHRDGIKASVFQLGLAYKL